MRQVLVEAARRKRRRNGAPAPRWSRSTTRSTPPAAAPTICSASMPRSTSWPGSSPRQAMMVECRFFGGLDAAETAELLDISEATVLRDWRAARAWLAARTAQPRDHGRRQRWARVQDLFHEAADLPAGERAGVGRAPPAAMTRTCWPRCWRCWRTTTGGGIACWTGISPSWRAVRWVPPIPAALPDQRLRTVPHRRGCWARAGWAWSTSPGGPTWAAWRRSRSCATPGFRPPGASGSPPSSARWPSCNHPVHRPAVRRRHAPRRHAVVRHGVRRGRSPHRLLPNAGHAPSTGRLELFRAVCEAVQHAHSTPSSTATSSRRTSWSRPTASVKLLDFGIAKQLEDAGRSRRPDPHRPPPDDARPTRRPNRSAASGSASTPMSTRSASSCTSCSTGRLPLRSRRPHAGRGDAIVIEREPSARRRRRGVRPSRRRAATEPRAARQAVAWATSTCSA